MSRTLNAAVLLALSAPALAQTGTMYLSHDDPDGEVAPGQVVRFEMRLDWTVVNQILWIDGHIRGTPDLGSIVESYPPSLPAYGFLPWSGLHQRGSHRGANIDSFVRAFTPSAYGGGFIVPSPSKQPLYGTFMSWDWVAPAVTEVTTLTFSFEPNQTEYGGVWAAPSYVNPIPAVPVSITMISAPVHIDPGNLYCPADLTATATVGLPGYGVPNGTLESDDFFYYLARFAAADPRADLTHAAALGTPGFGVPNGILNNDDFFYYLSLFAAGC